MAYWITNSECLRESEVYIVIIEYWGMYRQGCIYTREGVIHQATNRRNGGFGEETIHARDNNDKTTNEQER